MLKNICKLFLGLVVCAGSACVTPTHASSADDTGYLEDIIITRIQASGEFGAKDEYIILHNNSGVELNITDWCLTNKSNIEIACFANRTNTTIEGFYVPPYGDIVVVSKDFAAARAFPENMYTFVYEVSSQSSGSIVNSADKIMLFDSGGGSVDLKIWDTAIPTGKVLSRILLMSMPALYANSRSNSDWITENRPALPQSSVIKITTTIDADPITDPDPTPEPNPDADSENENTPESPNGSELEPVTTLLPIITEVFPNPVGSDAGGEFVELYNPNEHDSVLLTDFTMIIGATTFKSYAFPVGARIPPLSYVAYRNQEMGYTLPNTTGRVQLAKDGVSLGEAVEYVSPKDDYSWALFEGAWQYVKPATPNLTNAMDEAVIEKSSSLNAAKPCADNQFRNPETGRCKLTSNSISTQTACKEGQERNSITNRCRNTAAATEPTPCKEGQERNPETNRCRTIVKMSTASYGLSVQDKADATMNWYYWVAIATIILLVISYAVWEWRQELLTLGLRLKRKFAKHSN